MNRQTTTPKSYTKEAGLTEAGDKEEAETADLWKAPKKCSSISMGQTLATKPTNVPKRRKPSKRMEVWPTQPTQPFQTPQLPYNPPFQPIPAFSYNPYPANWQPPQSNNSRLPHQPINRTTREELPPPPLGPPTKTRKPKHPECPIHSTPNLRHDNANFWSKNTKQEKRIDLNLRLKQW